MSALDGRPYVVLCLVDFLKVKGLPEGSWVKLVSSVSGTGKDQVFRGLFVGLLTGH